MKAIRDWLIITALVAMLALFLLPPFCVAWLFVALAECNLRGIVLSVACLIGAIVLLELCERWMK